MNCRLYKVVLCYMFLYVFLLNWLSSVSGILTNILLIILVYLMILDYYLRHEGKIYPNKKEFLCGGIFLGLIILNIIKSGGTYRACINAFFLLWSLICIFYIGNIYLEKQNAYDFLLSKKWLFGLNVYFNLNVILIFIQSKVPGFLMLGHSNHFDNMVGLFGGGNTHVFTVFCGFLTCMNIEYICKKSNRKGGGLYILITVILMLSLVPINDNTAFIILFPIEVILYLLVKFKITIKRILQNLAIFLIIIIIFILLISYNSTFNEFINDRFGYKIEAYLYSKNNYLTKTGFGDERIRALEFAIEYGEGLFLGKGFNVNLDDVTTLEHYWEYGNKNKTYVGISDLSGITYMCGFWFYLLFCFVTSYLLNRIVNKNKIKNMLLSFLLVIMFTVYTTLAKSPGMAIMLPLYCIIIGLSRKGKNIYEYFL